jgi:hypothetical protein
LVQDLKNILKKLVDSFALGNVLKEGIPVAIAKEELFTLIQKTLQNYGVKINHYPSSYATLTKLILMQQYGVVFVKSTQENLAKITLPTTRYLYIYKKATHHDVFVACKRGSCFAYGKRYQEFKKALE